MILEDFKYTVYMVKHSKFRISKCAWKSPGAPFARQCANKGCKSISSGEYEVTSQ